MMSWLYAGGDGNLSSFDAKSGEKTVGIEFFQIVVTNLPKT